MKLLAALLIALYVLVRMLADPFFWQAIPEYYSYAFEMIFVGVFAFLFRRQIHMKSRPGVGDALWTLAMVGAGFGVYKGAGLFDIAIPFDLSATLTVFLLVLWGPLLEELIFRFALWECFETLFASNALTLIATAALFAAGHFTAYWAVPPELQSFILYQTGYVFVLGLVTGMRRLESNSFLSALYVHFGFNLGFFLASRF